MPPGRRKGRAPEALRRAVPLLLSAYFFGAIACSLLPLEAVRLLQLSYPEPREPAAAGNAALAVEPLPVAPSTTALTAGGVPSHDWRFPEARPPWFSLHPAASVECTGPLGPAAQYAGPQAALQACLGSPWCTCVSWRGGQPQSARLYSGHRPRHEPAAADAVLALRLGCKSAGEQQQPRGSLEAPQPPCAAPHVAAQAAAAAVKAAGGRITHSLAAANDSDLCPPGLYPVASTVGGMACSPCPRGYCGLLPGAQLLPASSLDKPLQAAVAASPFNAAGELQLRGLNPSVLHWRGRRFAFARASNISSCSSALEGQESSSSKQAGVGLAVASRVMVCDLGDAAGPLDRSVAQRCREIPVDTAALAVQVPGTQDIPDLQGVEDPRAFVHGAQPHLLVNFHVMQPDRRAWTRRRQWWEAEAPLHSHMAALRLSPDLHAVEHAAVLRCPGLHSMRQKNWMPLPLSQPGGELLFLTDIQPLTLVTADLATGTCRLVRGAGSAADGRNDSSEEGGGSGSSGRRSGGAGGAKDSAVASAAEGSAASLAAVLGGARLHGGSPFVSIGPSRYLSIVHHKEVLPYGRIYTHHWVLLEGSNVDSLRVAWVSEGFRLPDMQGVWPSRDVQFASSLTLHGDDLLVGYGAGDCHAVLARVPRFQAQLAAWLQHGLGSQAVSSAPNAVQQLRAADSIAGRVGINSRSSAVVKWEASLFGREERSAEAAAAIGTRWQQSALPAVGAQLLLRHLDQRPGPHHPRQLGGLPLVLYNEQNSLVADVAISHARLAELVPAVDRVWLPWLPHLGTSAPAASIELLRRHASRVLVPTTYHRTSLVRLLGFPVQRVAVLPQPAPADDLCPAGFEALPGRLALQELGGPPVPAQGVIFLHQAPPGWHYGAGLLLEAYARSFSAADNVTLVLHQLPAGDEDAEERGKRQGTGSLETGGDSSTEPGSSNGGVGMGSNLGDGSSTSGSGSLSLGNSRGSSSPPDGGPAWAAAAGSPATLAQRVAALAQNASAPRVVLLARTPRFGRWADKLLQAADVAVLPYLGGTAGRELVRPASCGRPLVTTTGGPAVDVVVRAAWLVPSKLRRCPLGGAAPERGAARVGLGCLEVSPNDLGSALRAAWRSAEERQQRGAAAAQAAEGLVETAGWDALADSLWGHVRDHLAREEAS